MIRDLMHARDRLFGRPLLIRSDYADHLVAGLRAAMLRRSTKPAMAFDKDGAPSDPPPRPRGYRVDRGIALMPVRGVLVRRAGQIDADSIELQSYERLRSSLRQARADKSVRGILLELDTPGGEAGGIFDLADELHAIGREKPVWSIANDDALSAGYVIAAATNKVWITNTGSAGSVGVVALHLDQSGFDEKEGFHFTYIHRGAHKIDGHPHAPLSETATDAIRIEVDRLYEMLITNVAAHRTSLSPDALRATEAAVYSGEQALDQRLADQIGTLDQAHAAMAAQTAPLSSRALAQHHNQRVSTMENDTFDPGHNALTDPPVDNIVNLDQVRATALAEGRHQAGEIAALCALAGYPETSAEHINSGASLEAVRAALQARQAADSTKRQVEALDTSSAVRSTQLAELNAAANARFTAMQARH